MLIKGLDYSLLRKKIKLQRDNIIEIPTKQETGDQCKINITRYRDNFSELIKCFKQQAIEYEKGTGKAKSRTFTIAPVKKYTNTEIKAIRNNSGMPQTVFANYMGVSKKTVEAWELGRTHPTGPAYRLIGILEQGKAEELALISACN